mgnify:CR=1 FL=1
MKIKIIKDTNKKDTNNKNSDDEGFKINLLKVNNEGD